MTSISILVGKDFLRNACWLLSNASSTSNEMAASSLFYFYYSIFSIILYSVCPLLMWYITTAVFWLLNHFYTSDMNPNWLGFVPFIHHWIWLANILIKNFNLHLWKKFTCNFLSCAAFALFWVIAGFLKQVFTCLLLSYSLEELCKSSTIHLLKFGKIHWWNHLGL